MVYRLRTQKFVAPINQKKGCRNSAPGVLLLQIAYRLIPLKIALWWYKLVLAWVQQIFQGYILHKSKYPTSMCMYTHIFGHLIKKDTQNLNFRFVKDKHRRRSVLALCLSTGLADFSTYLGMTSKVPVKSLFLIN